MKPPNCIYYGRGSNDCGSGEREETQCDPANCKVAKPRSKVK